MTFNKQELKFSNHIDATLSFRIDLTMNLIIVQVQRSEQLLGSVFYHFLALVFIFTAVPFVGFYLIATKWCQWHKVFFLLEVKDFTL